MEKEMRKTNDTELTSKTHNSKASLEVRELTSKLNHATLDDHGTLADSELGAVTGGTKAKGSGSGSWFEALAQAWGNALDAKAASL
jgi:hypothetical protein